MAIALASIYDTNHGVSVERRLIGRLRHRVVILNAQSRYPMQLNSQPETKFANDSWLVEQGVNLDDLNKEVAGLLRREGVRAAVADAFASCTIQDYVAKFKDDRESQLFKTTHTNEAIQILLNDVAKIALAADLRRVTIILDDFYYLVRNTEPSARDSLAREWRDIVVDGNYKATRGNVFNWVAVMHSRTASTFIQAWEGVSLHSVAPMAVIQGNAVVQPGVHLRALPLRLGSQLLESYIKYSRAGRASTPIYPFAPEALNYILEFANRKGRESEGKYDPRSALEAAHEVFVRALLDRDDHNMIDLNFARHVLDGTPLQEPEQTLSIEAAEAVDELVTPPRQQRLSLNAVCGCGCHAEDGTSAHDLVALSSDGAPDTGSQSIIGYVCVACNSPASPMP